MPGPSELRDVEQAEVNSGAKVSTDVSLTALLATLFARFEMCTNKEYSRPNKKLFHLFVPSRFFTYSFGE